MRSLIVLFLVACGGTTTDPIPKDDSGTTKDGSVDGGGGCPMPTPSCLCGTPTCQNGQWICQSCQDPCMQMQQQLEAARRSLQQCCPSCKNLQCQGVAQDVCCAITVNMGDVAAFEAL